VRIAVIGANGRIGSALLERFAEGGSFEPVAVCRNAMGAALVDGFGCEVRVGSIAASESARRLLSDCDVAINCAWAIGLPGESRRTNNAIVQSISAVTGVKAAVFLSSTAVYGTCIDGTRSTFGRPRPDTNYGRVKLSLERFAARAAAGARKRWVVLRLGHVYGPHQWLSREILELLEEPTFRLAFDGARPSNALHIDHLAATVAALASGSEASGIYNVTDTPHRKWREVFDWHSEALGLPRATGMTDDASAAWRERFVRRSRRPAVLNGMVDVARWLGALPFDRMIATEAVREQAQSLMMRAPEFIAYRAKIAHGALIARRYIRALPRRAAQPRLWHCSDVMPGRYLTPGAGRSAAFEDSARQARRLREWFAAFSEPRPI
jgi:nucleoside-diphosphate-sugar epimerase